MQKFEAEEQMIRIRLRDDYGGAMCSYSDEVEEKGGYAKSVDDFELFSSAKQLVIINTVASSEPYVDINGQTVTPIDFDELLSDPQNGVLAYFPLHHERFQMVLKRDWVFNVFGPQDTEKVREYFGDEIGLFYTWVGFYISMLWLPAVWGLCMFAYQCLYGMENPYTLSVGLANVTWGVLFVKLWHVLQACRSYQWDTLNFEEEEQKIGLLDSFKENPLTLASVHVNEITGEMDDYWYDDGSYWPPTGRKRTQLLNKAAILAFDALAILLVRLSWTAVARPMMSDDSVVAGAVAMGALDFAMKKAFDVLFFGMPDLGFEEGLVEWMVQAENWPTRTALYDAEIWSTFYLKVVIQYFGFVYVAFLANYAPLFPGEHCPSLNCLPVLTIMLLTETVLVTSYQVFEIIALPFLVKQAKAYSESLGRVAKPGARPRAKAAMEQQFERLDPPRVLDLMRDLVYDHVGQQLLFGTAAPLTALLLLAFGAFYLRVTAHNLVSVCRRRLPQGAEDIGAYEMVINNIQMLSIVTNALLLGCTSSTFYFYSPSMSTTSLMWLTLIVEHALILVKVCVSSAVPDEPAQAIAEYQLQQDRKRKQFRRWNLTERTIT